MSKKNSRYGKHSLGYPITNKLTDRYKNEKEKTIKKRTAVPSFRLTVQLLHSAVKPYPFGVQSSSYVNYYMQNTL